MDKFPSHIGKLERVELYGEEAYPYREVRTKSLDTAGRMQG